MYALLMICIRWMTNENLLYSSGNSTQRSVGDSNGKEIQKTGDVCMCVADSLCYIVGTQHCKATILQYIYYIYTILQLYSNYTPKINLKIKMHEDVLLVFVAVRGKNAVNYNCKRL